MKLHPDFLTVLNAVEVHSLEAYSLLGQRKELSQIQLLHSETLPDFQPWSDLEVPGHMLQVLESDIYNTLYKRRKTTDGSKGPAMEKGEHLITLSSVNHANGGWEAGWQISKDALPQPARIAVSKGRVRFYAQASEVHDLGGGNCKVRVPKELRRLNGHYFMVFGDAQDKGKEALTGTVLRFYWHLKSDGAVPYMDWITERFMEAGIPFRTKVIADPVNYEVCDAGVLYVDRLFHEPAMALVREAALALIPHLNAGVPMFTEQLADGLGFALDPGNGMSFGMELARMVALSLIRSHLLGKLSPDEQQAELKAVLAHYNVLPGAPHFVSKSSEFSSTAMV